MKLARAFSDIVKITKYLTDIRDCDGMNKAMKPLYGRLAAGLDDDLR